MTERQENFFELASKYAEPRPRAVEELMRRVLGTPVANGYTTVQQAAEMTQLLGVGLNDTVLDLGTGRGWPGLHVSAETGCRVVLSDLTVEAAVAARGTVGRAARPRPIVVASGTALPFGPCVFKAVVHADVLCWLPDKLSVLRECHRVLVPGGRLAFLTITVPVGLKPEEKAIANDVAAAFTVTEPPLMEQMDEAGFTEVVEVDRTAAFLGTCEAILQQRAASRNQLVLAEGVEVYEEEVGAKERLRDGIRQGVVTRSLVSGRRL